jgi:hypothetical protein
MRKLAAVTFATLALSAIAVAQEPKKAPLSPPMEVKWASNAKAITINYSAPSKRGRAIMGALVPYGQVWRTGANAATKLTTTTEVMLGGLHVPAGTYTLFTIPGEKEWTPIVNKQTGQWGTNYDEKQDLGRVKMTVTPLKTPVEQFAFEVNDKALALSWENVKASVPVTIH